MDNLSAWANATLPNKRCQLSDLLNTSHAIEACLAPAFLALAMAAGVQRERERERERETTESTISV